MPTDHTDIVVQIFRSMFHDYDELRGLLETADILAYADDWPELYDEKQLANNQVPVYSATYIEDMVGLLQPSCSSFVPVQLQQDMSQEYLLQRYRLAFQKSKTDLGIIVVRALRLCQRHSVKNKELQEFRHQCLIS